MHVTTTTDDWDLESIPSAEFANLSSPSTLGEDDHGPEIAVVATPSGEENAASLSAAQQQSPGLVLDSFIPILIKIQSALSIEENEYHIVNDIVDSEWKELQEYARGVEELTFSDTTLPKVADAVFFRLGQLHGANASLFPSLSKLHIANTTSSPIPYLELFFSKSLHSVSIKGISNSSKMTMASFLKKVGAHTKMSHLVLDSINMSPEIFTAISQCSHLTSLELANLTGALDYTSLGVIAYLPRLESFRIDTKNVTKIHPLATAFPAKPKYTRIESFSFVGNFSTLEGIISDLVDAPLLRCIHIEVIKYDPVTSPGKKITGNAPIAEIMKLISGRRQTSMTEYTFKVNQGLGAFPDDTVKTLSSLQNLAHLDISGSSILDLDKGLADVATIWPKLITLRFPLMETNAKSSHGLTLSTLHRIAKSCPDLQTFQGLIIIPDTTPSWSSADPANRPAALTHGLKSLLLGSVGNSQLNQMNSATLGSVHYVARYLYAMFPNLEEPPTLSKLHPMFWTQVYDCMKLCRDASEIDRSRGKPSSS